MLGTTDVVNRAVSLSFPSHVMSCFSMLYTPSPLVCLPPSPAFCCWPAAAAGSPGCGTRQASEQPGGCCVRPRACCADSQGVHGAPGLRGCQQLGMCRELREEMFMFAMLNHDEKVQVNVVTSRADAHEKAAMDSHFTDLPH